MKKLEQEIHAYPTAKLSVEHVCKDFKTKAGIVRALDNVSLTINEGEFVCFVGPSGCGSPHCSISLPVWRSRIVDWRSLMVCRLPGRGETVW